MKTKPIQFCAILLFALVMGVFWGTWFSLSRSMASLPPETFLAVGHAIIANLAVPMRMLMPAAIVSGVLVLCALPRSESRAFVWTSIALSLMIGALLITLIVEVPIDNRIKVWTPATLPEGWEGLRDHWETFHALRTFISIASLASLVAGALSSPTSSSPTNRGVRGS